MPGSSPTCSTYLVAKMSNVSSVFIAQRYLRSNVQNRHPFYHLPEVGPDPVCRSRLRQDSPFFFLICILTQSQKFVKNRTHIRGHFSISVLAGVCVFISLAKTWVNYGWIDDCNRSLNRSRIPNFENLQVPDPDPDSKIFGRGAESASEYVTPATSLIHQSTPTGRAILTNHAEQAFPSCVETAR